MEANYDGIDRTFQMVAARLEQIDEGLREQYTGRPVEEIIDPAREALGSAFPDSESLREYAEAVSNDRPFTFKVIG